MEYIGPLLLLPPPQRVKVLKIHEAHIKRLHSDLTHLNIFINSTSVIKNGRTFAIACISFAFKLVKNIFTWDELKKILRRMNDSDCLIVNRLDDEQKVFDTIFGLIGDEVLGPCFDLAKYKASSDGKVIASSDYLKSDINYYKEVLQKFYTKFNMNRELRKSIESIIIKK